jgi:hypothetical protein
MRAKKTGIAREEPTTPAKLLNTKKLNLAERVRFEPDTTP